MNANNTQRAKAHKQEVYSVIKEALTTYYGNRVFVAVAPKNLAVRFEDEGSISTVEVSLTGRANDASK